MRIPKQSRSVSRGRSRSRLMPDQGIGAAVYPAPCAAGTCFLNEWCYNPGEYVLDSGGGTVTCLASPYGGAGWYSEDA